MLEPRGRRLPPLSREIALDAGDLLLLYTDGLAAARTARAVRRGAHRHPPSAATPAAADVLCKYLLEAARDFSRVGVATHRRLKGRRPGIPCHPRGYAG